MLPAHAPASARLPALRICIAQEEPTAADHDDDPLGPTRIHLPPVLRMPTGLDAQRADLLNRAAGLAQLRAELLQTRDRFQNMTHHARRAEVAEESMKNALARGVGVACVVGLLGAGLLLAGTSDPYFNRPGLTGPLGLDFVIFAVTIPVPVLAGPYALRYAYHARRGGNALVRDEAQRGLHSLANQLNAQRADYARRFEVYRRRELLALRREGSDVVIASTGLPRDLALMVLDYEDPGSELLRSAVPLPRRRVEIVEVD